MTIVSAALSNTGVHLSLGNGVIVSVTTTGLSVPVPGLPKQVTVPVLELTNSRPCDTANPLAVPSTFAVHTTLPVATSMATTCPCPPANNVRPARIIAWGH